MAAPETIKVALSADGHSGGEGFPKIAEWKAAARQAREEGAIILAHIGDWAHHGLPEEAGALGKALIEGFLGETEEEQRKAEALGLRVIGTLGNHDGLRGMGDEIVITLRSLGITLLENQTEIFTLPGGTRIGVLGLDGSLPPDEFAQVEQLDFEQRIAKLHEATEAMYLPGVRGGLRRLAAAQVDAGLALVHMPVFPEQYSDTYPHTQIYEITPRIGEEIVASGVIDLVGSGHVHSHSATPMWRHASGRGMSGDMPFASVAGQTLQQEGLPLAPIFEIPLRRGRERS